MWVIATVLGILGVILFFILLLAIPIDLIFYVEKDADFRSKVRVQWLYGLIGKDIRKKKKKPETKEEKRKRIIKAFQSIFRARGFLRKRSLKLFLALLRTRGFLRNIIKFARRVVKLIKVRNSKVDLQIGLSDPADTGLLFAVVGPAMVYIRSCSSLDIQVEPDFEQENLRGHFTGELRAFPISFIGPLVLLAFSSTTLRAIKAMIMATRK